MAGVDASCNSLMYSLFLEGSDQLCNYTQGTTSLSNKSCAHASIHGCPFLVDSNSRLCAQCAIAVANGQHCSDFAAENFTLGRVDLEYRPIRTLFCLSMPQLRSCVMYFWSRIALASESSTTRAGWILPPSHEKDSFITLEKYRLSRASYNVMSKPQHSLWVHAFRTPIVDRDMVTKISLFKNPRRRRNSYDSVGLAVRLGEWQGN
ncbi:hypothetical protein GGI35DRAFT_451419 [Trichoderma velutinum]